MNVQSNAKDTVTLEIDALSYGPYGIGRLEGKAVMVSHTAPGDTVEARIIEAKGRYAVGEATRIITPSAFRQTPPCPYVGACGGCSWQHLRYAAQLKAKQQSVADALHRIGKLADFELRPIIPSAGEYHYRRRVRLQVAADGALGFYGAASHHLVAIDSCLIADARLNAALDSVRAWTKGLATRLDHVELVAGDEPEEIIAIAQAADRWLPSDEPACEKLIADNERLAGLIVAADHWRRIWGKAAITVKLLAGLFLTVDADVFTQVNAEGNRRMLDELLTAGEFHRADRVLELYSGAGNFTLPMAQRVRKLAAIEGDRDAVSGAKLNAQKNALDNIRWSCSAVPKAVAQLRKRHEQFTKIVLDPPRAGAKGLETDLAALGASQIFYISCNPTTLARDLAALSNYGYKLRMVQPIDFFPQTFHVETLAVIER
jgi:23S rRNA (uracil1939-C5)-methyltransferase